MPERALLNSLIATALAFDGAPLLAMSALIIAACVIGEGQDQPSILAIFLTAAILLMVGIQFALLLALGS